MTLSRLVRSIETLIALQLHHLPTRIPEPELLISRIDFRIILRRQRALPRLKILLLMRLSPCLRMYNNPLPQILRQRNLRRHTPPRIPNLV
jgi:hypothetical protein